MSKISFRWIIVIAALVTLAMPATALPQTSEPCANVSISLSPPVVARGGTVNVDASIENCSTARQRYTIKYELTTPCTRAVLLSIPVRFDAGASFSASFSFRIPSFFCRGDYAITVKVFSGTTLLSSSTAMITVV
ncbi:MAG TPA: hypothetical protein VF131_23165 [Blastocatellia bacterium]|nr:hypothetical protein [Blastocatellia bacterium]